MPQLTSSLLIVNHPNPTELMLGAEFASSWSEAMGKAEATAFRAAILPLDTEEEVVLKLLQSLSYNNPEIVISLVDTKEQIERYPVCLSQFEIYHVLKDFQVKNFEEVAVAAIERARQIDQSEELAKLVRQQNKRLSDFQIQLQDRISKRHKFLEDSKRKLSTTNYRVEALHKALVAVQKSTSINEMESLLTEALQEAMKLSWIRIIFSTRGNLKTKLSHSRRMVSLFTTSLTKEQEILGDVFFARPLEDPFSRTDRDFLRRIADTISIALDRIVKLEELETLQQQWEVTFNAISNPLSIVSENREIIQTNRAFEQQTGLTSEALIGESCYKALFDRETPCENCHLGKGFELGKVSSALGNEFEFKVQSYAIRSSETVYVNLYQDQTQQRALERRILQSTKMVEIGTIGSSIAHELNNPIGGIINYLQLIKMETPTDDPIYEDINEMEKGAQRCKEIVQNLLSFTRKHDSSKTEEVSIADVINRAIQITDLQARSKGVTLSFKSEEDAKILGQRNLVVQAIANVLQNSIEAIEELKKEDRSLRGQVEISHVSELDQEIIVIEDNGVGIPEDRIQKVLNPLYTSKNPNLHSGLGLTLSFQIINEMNGDLEIRSPQGKGTIVRMVISRPVFVESGRGFDAPF